MEWRPIRDGKKSYPLNHIHPHSFEYDVRDSKIKVIVTYGFHVFTDEKETGREIKFRGETRYFSKDRYDSSFNLKNLIEREMIFGKARMFISRGTKEQFYYLEMHDYVIFFELRLKDGTTDTLKLHIVSAYEKDTWGTLPKGKLYEWNYIAFAKLNGIKLKK